MTRTRNLQGVMCAALVAAGIALIPQVAQAQLDGEFRVVAMPWVGSSPLVPHDGASGENHYFQAVARGQCDQQIQLDQAASRQHFGQPPGVKTAAATRSG